ncbi:LppP/LprE family lipoprotein [Pseudofrankia sp. BMG5.36]|uniref:LppP/LprE family lipoprotein n=1 Tax=Pseudofrankia sp. BMG5.36 TaxID=1834512 RepID=UPI000AFD2775|nr:LppP/LprE family lipoprotein [Pseudofrankia sp. BMG5.36]
MTAGRSAREPSRPSGAAEGAAAHDPAGMRAGHDAARGTGHTGRAGRPTNGRRLALALPLAALAALLTGGGPVAAAASPAASSTAPGPVATASPTTASPTGGLSVAQAIAVVRASGYTPTDTTGYDPDRTLSVILGMLATSVDGHPQRAFLFHDGRYVATDAAVPSATVSWIWSTDDTVALQYQLYRPEDPMCCPTAGAATVRFSWNGAAAAPRDTLPPTGWNAPASRR